MLYEALQWGCGLLGLEILLASFAIEFFTKRKYGTTVPSAAFDAADTLRLQYLAFLKTSTGSAAMALLALTAWSLVAPTMGSLTTVAGSALFSIVTIFLISIAFTHLNVIRSHEHTLEAHHGALRVPILMKAGSYATLVFLLAAGVYAAYLVSTVL